MSATVHSTSNTSMKSKNGSLTCSINGISALGHRKGILIASLNVNSLLFLIDEICTLIWDLGLHILAVYKTKLHYSIDDVLISIYGCSIRRCHRNRKGGVVPPHFKDTILGKCSIHNDYPELPLAALYL